MGPAFRTILFATCFLFLSATSFPQNGDNDDASKSATNKALQIWMQKAFVDSCSKHHRSHLDRVQEGSQIYQREKEPSYSSTGTSGLARELSIKELGDLIDSLRNDGFISEEEKGEMKTILAEESMFKTIREHAHVADGVITFGITGFIKLSNKEDQQMGSILYTFRSFKLKSDNVGVSSTRDQSCVIWGTLCPSRFQFNGLSDNQSDDLSSFMVSEALDQFANDNLDGINQLKSDAEAHNGSLPNAVKEALAELEKNADKQPDQVLNCDPLDGNNFDI